MAKLPFMQFYPADWIKDTRTLSLEARGAWIDLICAMWEAPVRGKLDWTVSQFEIFLGCRDDMNTATEIWNELIASGVGELNMEPEDSNGDKRVTIMSRRISREEHQRNQGAARQSRHRSHSDNDLSRPIYQKSEVRGQKEDKIKDPVKPPADPVDKLKEKERSESAWARDLHAMWVQVQQMAKRQPERFDKTLGAWVGTMIRKKWQPTEIKTALMDFVRFEDSNSQIAEWYPYLNAILQKTRTKKVQGESAQYKDYDAKSMSDILAGIGLGKSST